MSDLGVDELAAELSEFEAPEKAGARSPREERIIAGFEDIQRFVEQHGRPPQHGEDRDIFERLYAVRLDRLRALEDCRAILKPLDHQGLLKGRDNVDISPAETMDDDALMAELEDLEGASGITELRHVRASAEKRAAEEIASREPCSDFERFKPLFDKVQADLTAGRREARPYKEDTEIAVGQFFVLGGQKAFVAHLYDEFTTPEGRPNRKMRVIFDNGVESEPLLRSFQRALYKKENFGRRITDPVAGPLFEDHVSEGDHPSGTIYVLRSKSNLPKVAEHREVLHKIGVTGATVERRITNARNEPTFLMADVEIVAKYELFNVHRSSLEHLIHRVFEPARLEIEITDRFGKPVTAREWFLVPLFVIDDAVERIRDGSITRWIYNPNSARLVERPTP